MLGSIKTDTVGDIEFLRLHVTSLAAGGFDALEDSSGAHQVAAGDTLRIGMYTAQSGGHANFELGYDDDAAGTNYVILLPAGVALSSTSTEEHTVYLEVPANKYFVVKNTHGSSAIDVDIHAMGTER